MFGGDIISVWFREIGGVPVSSFNGTSKRHATIRLLSSLILLCCGLAYAEDAVPITAEVEAGVAMLFPGDTWAKGSPESQGFDSEKLKTAL